MSNDTKYYKSTMVIWTKSRPGAQIGLEDFQNLINEGEALLTSSETEETTLDEFVPKKVVRLFSAARQTFDISRLDRFDREHLLLFATIDHTARDKTFQIYSGIVERLEKYGLVSLDAPKVSSLNSITIVDPNGAPMVVTVTAEGKEVVKLLIAGKATS